MKNVRPKKHLGQHFLTEPAIARRVAASLTRHKGVRNVLEIGPGTGILTDALITESEASSDGPNNLRFIEIDRESIAHFRETRPDRQDQLIEGDFLRLNLETLFDGAPFALVGNFPYNISSQILFRALDHRDIIPELVGMFQREVARRVVSGPHNKEYGILSVLIQAFYDAEYLFTVDPESFNPPPKVKSGVIRLTRNERSDLPITYAQLKTVVKTAFNTRRKTLRNSLRPLLTPEVELPADLLSLRAENLSPQEFIGIAEAIFAR